jgi:hypothetical protein
MSKKGSVSSRCGDVRALVGPAWLTISSMSSKAGCICAVVHPGQTHTLVAFLYILSISLTCDPFSTSSFWLMQTASTQTTRDRSLSLNRSKASLRFCVTIMILPSQSTSILFAGSPHAYETASYFWSILQFGLTQSAVNIVVCVPRVKFQKSYKVFGWQRTVLVETATSM